MRLRARTGSGLVALLALLACIPMGAQAGAASQEQLRSAMSWLVPAWDDDKEAALQARQAAAAGPGYLTEPQHIPGSSQTYTRKQLNSEVPDWWPQEHPPMPPIVVAGVGKAIACAACHQPNGAAYPGNASLAGLPEHYIIGQLHAFHSGNRISSEMQAEVAELSDADLHAAASYFSGLQLHEARAHVIEASQVPSSHVESWMLVPTPGAATEALGQRIVELPENVTQAELLDAHTRFIAYVPTGSIAAGKHLVTAGADKLPACSSCHGPDLRGGPAAPPLAGRSPTYMVRQLARFALGERKGPYNAPMQAVANGMSLDDMIAAAAYAASLSP